MRAAAGSPVFSGLDSVDNESPLFARPVAMLLIFGDMLFEILQTWAEKHNLFLKKRHI